MTTSPKEGEDDRRKSLKEMMMKSEHGSERTQTTGGRAR
jgi:hypothetical protein